MWYNGQLRRVALKQLGLRIQLGHVPGTHCICPEKAFGDDFVILDTSGIHEVGLDFCGCEAAQLWHIQLLRHRLFPTMGIAPKTASTFCLMEFYHILHNQTKSSGFEFYNTLARCSDNTGTIELKASVSPYVQYLWVLRLPFNRLDMSASCVWRGCGSISRC